jgi:hypothetical protein
MDFYAEITRKQLKQIENGELEFALPEGVTMTRKPKSRACYFSCDSKEAAEELIEGFDASYINWQEN